MNGPMQSKFWERPLINRQVSKLRTACLIAAACLSVVAAACGSSSPAAAPSTTASSSPATSAAPSPTGLSTTTTGGSVSGTRHFNLSGSFATPDGYSFDFTATAAMGTPTTGNSSQLPPGQDALLLPVSASGTIKNTTPGGRDYSSDPLDDATLYALYKSPTPACPVPSTGALDAIYMDLNSNVYCLIEIAMLTDAAGEGVPAGKTVTLSMQPPTCYSVDNIPGGCGEINAPSSDEPFDYLAANTQRAMSALASAPDLVVLMGGGNGAPTNSCQPSDTEGWVVASTVPITSCS